VLGSLDITGRHPFADVICAGYIVREPGRGSASQVGVRRRRKARMRVARRRAGYLPSAEAADKAINSLAVVITKLRSKLRRCTSAVRGLISSALAVSLLVLPASK
jgi:hypothetical protein